ncbi:hypothetical protein PHLGIDRAFT_129899 [Phlebiopsis gigantea 11061_1 CR5-6]|uniref:DUF6533 domain-containing protein n=1 Tax=Phlebiopsis gigantea (strain 11061_1 CR5-6) TaxID=745531 RepID=A0A0C3RTA8_PHLG1|nr:hypothetical protein PHLGIDRAFT_129899 [Phlebiopsis gigantea 11061_1 CR5-6]
MNSDWLFVAIPALVFYEYLITFGQELMVVWRRKFTWASVLLVAIRWTILLEAIFLVLPQPSETRLVSMQYKRRESDVVALPKLSWTDDDGPEPVFSALRIFAISGRNLKLFLVVLIQGLAPVFINAIITAHAGVNFPFIGPKLVICQAAFVPPRPLALVCKSARSSAIAIASRVPVVISEAIILVVTWKKTFYSRQNLLRARITTSLTQSLLRDGTLYFVVLLLLNVAQLVILSSVDSLEFIGPLLDTLPPILISRFIMNLRRATGHPGLTEEHSDSQAAFTGVAFRDVTNTLRELGQELDHGLSSPVRSEGSSFRQRSVASQSVWSSSSGYDAVDGDGFVNIALEEIRQPAAVHRTEAPNRTGLV